MKSLVALLFLVMFCSLHLTANATLASDAAKSTCCEKFSNAVIPLRRVKSFFWTGSNCPTKAIVFQTDKRKICVNPNAAWVTGHIAKLDKRTTTVMSKTTTV